MRKIVFSFLALTVMCGAFAHNTADFVRINIASAENCVSGYVETDDATQTDFQHESHEAIRQNSYRTGSESSDVSQINNYHYGYDIGSETSSTAQVNYQSEIDRAAQLNYSLSETVGAVVDLQKHDAKPAKKEETPKNRAPGMLNPHDNKNNLPNIVPFDNKNNTPFNRDGLKNNDVEPWLRKMPFNKDGKSNPTRQKNKDDKRRDDFKQRREHKKDGQRINGDVTPDIITDNVNPKQPVTHMPLDTGLQTKNSKTITQDEMNALSLSGFSTLSASTCAQKQTDAQSKPQTTMPSVPHAFSQLQSKTLSQSQTNAQLKTAQSQATADNDNTEKNQAAVRESIHGMVMEIANIEDCVVIAYGDSVAIAIKTKGIVLASHDRKLKLDIEEKVRKAYPSFNNVFVLTRVKDYYALKGLETKLNEGANPLDIYKSMIEIYKNRDPILPAPRDREKNPAKER